MVIIDLTLDLDRIASFDSLLLRPTSKQSLMRTLEDQLSLEALSVLLKAFPSSRFNSSNSQTTLLITQLPLRFPISLINISSIRISLRQVNINRDLSLLNPLNNSQSIIGECREVVNQWLV